MLLKSLSNRGYGFSLSDGNSWEISSASEEHDIWLRKFAAIMNLCRHFPVALSRLVFFQNTHKTKNGQTLLEKYRLRPDIHGININTQWISREHKITWIQDNDVLLCELTNTDNEENKYINMWFSLFPVYQKSIENRGLPFHTALVEKQGKGFLLVGYGNAGKSTCCKRLSGEWTPLCDDEALVVMDKHQTYRVHPFPTWSDYIWKRAENTWDIQYSVPLHTIFFLEQSQTDEVIPLGQGEAAVWMTASAVQVYRKFWRNTDKENQIKYRQQLFNNACEISRKIPAYILRVSLHGKFWEKMESVIGSEE